MCGRYALTLPPARLREHFGYDGDHDFPPRSVISPTEPIAIVVAREFTAGRTRSLMLARWGFLPGFVKEPQDFPLLVNARAEGILDKASFAPAFRRRRCLVPADGYYVSHRRQTWLAATPDRAPLAFAGLYETYLDRNGSELDTACIVTTEANASLSALSDRMPAILPRDAFAVWLDHEGTPLAGALALLRPAPDDVLQTTRVTLR